MTSKRVETCKLDVHIVKSGGLSRLSPFHKYTWQWQAHAVGPKGSYVAAWSDVFKARGSVDLGPTSDHEMVEQARQEVL